jgi:hypothetical protein
VVVVAVVVVLVLPATHGFQATLPGVKAGWEEL